MRTYLVALVLALVAGCVKPKAKANAPVPAVAQTARPFVAAPTVSLVSYVQTGTLVRVQVATEITRDVLPTDDLAVVVSVDDEEVGRYPIVGRFQNRPTKIKQEIELPLGDYEIELAYQGTKFAGMPFRLANVPVWGGKTSLQLRMHPGTRVSLKQQKLWIGRWWPNDGPPPAWIVEWVREGQVVTTTSGVETYGIPSEANALVGGAAGAFRDTRMVQNTLWTYGEEYPLPPMVATTPGMWAARVVHGSSPPVAVWFQVLPGGQLAELSKQRIESVGWQESWSKRLPQRALSASEVTRLTAKLPLSSASQPFDEPDPKTEGPEPAVRVSTAGVRALFRSKELAAAWSEFLTLNSATVFLQQPVAMQKGAKAQAKDAADKRAKLRTLRATIDQLIGKQGGPWKPEEFPKS